MSNTTICHFSRWTHEATFKLSSGCIFKAEILTPILREFFGNIRHEFQMWFLGSFIDSKSMLHFYGAPILSVLLSLTALCACNTTILMYKNTLLFMNQFCCMNDGDFTPWPLIYLLYMKISKHSVLSPKVLKIPFGVVKVLFSRGEHTNTHKKAPL